MRRSIARRRRDSIRRSRSQRLEEGSVRRRSPREKNVEGTPCYPACPGFADGLCLGCVHPEDCDCPEWQVCANHPYRDAAFIDPLGGHLRFDFSIDPIPPLNATPDIPSRLIVGMKHPLRNEDGSPLVPPHPFVAIPLYAVWSAKGFVTSDIRDYFHLEPHHRVFFSTYTDDWKLLDLWLACKDDLFASFFRRLAGQVNVAAGINYSLYVDSPNLDQLVSLKRSYRSLVAIQEAGIVPVCEIGDLQQHNVEWIHEHDVRSFSINTQTIGKAVGRNQRVYFDVLTRDYPDALPEGSSIVIGGMSNHRIVRRLFAALAGRNWTPFLLTTDPFQLAVYHKEAEHHRTRMNWSLARTFAHNINLYRTLLGEEPLEA